MGESLVLWYRYTFTDVVFYPDTSKKENMGLANQEYLRNISSQKHMFLPHELHLRLWCEGWNRIIYKVANPFEKNKKKKHWCIRYCCFCCSRSSKINSEQIANEKILSNFEDTKGIARLMGTQWILNKVTWKENNEDLIKSSKQLATRWGHKDKKKEIDDVKSWGMKNENTSEGMHGYYSLGDVYLETAIVNKY